MKLYGYFRSSAAYRVRIALNLKGLSYDHETVHLVRGGGEQFSPAYKAMNPSALVPTLVDGDLTLGQSIAILEYLEERYPEPALLPQDIAARAHVRAFVQAVACDIHPLNNLRVRKYLSADMKLSEEQGLEWYRHWIDVGLASLEAMLVHSGSAGTFCFGDAPTMADVVLVPQMANARRFGNDLSGFPTLLRIEKACQELEAFRKALPSNQPDFES